MDRQIVEPSVPRTPRVNQAVVPGAHPIPLRYIFWTYTNRVFGTGRCHCRHLVILSLGAHITQRDPTYHPNVL